MPCWWYSDIHFRRLIDFFEQNDTEHQYLRATEIGIEKEDGGSSSTGYSIAKFYNAAEHLAAHHQGTLDAPVFRFGEILLIRAEAAAELGTISQTDLDATVNKLRERVGFNHKLTMSPAVDPKLEAEYPNVSANNATLIREIRRERIEPKKLGPT